MKCSSVMVGDSAPKFIAHQNYLDNGQGDFCHSANILHTRNFLP